MKKFHELLKLEETFILQTENINSHYKDPSSFGGKFYSDIKTLYEALPVNPLMLKNEMICKINDPSTDLPKDLYATMSAIVKER